MALDHPRNALAPGTMVHWYRIERVLGKGGFGITYLAHDTNLDKLVAIKEYLPADIAVRTEGYDIHPITTADEESFRWGRESFVHEARTLTNFDHDNIVHVYSVFQENQTAYIVMRYEQGKALSEVLDMQRTLTERELCAILGPILDGLARVHEAGFVHRDVQPANIYIRDDGSPVLLDFGAARTSAGLKHTVTVVVAPGYAPIEQYYRDSDELGPWTDIYGLAATAYRAIAGVAPIDAIERSRGILGSTRDVLVPATLAGAGRYTDGLLQAIDHGLKFNKVDRPQTTADWLAELGPGISSWRDAVHPDNSIEDVEKVDGDRTLTDGDSAAAPKSTSTQRAVRQSSCPESMRTNPIAWWKLAVVAHLIFFVVLVARNYGVFEEVELTVYDHLLSLRPAAAQPQSLTALVGVTEEDIHRFGWPLSDSLLADTLLRLEAAGASVIGVDVYRDMPIGEGAEQLKYVLGRYSNIIGIERFPGRDGTAVAAPQVLVARDQVGFSDIIPDDDGVVRRALLFVNDAERAAVSFPLRLATTYLQQFGIEPEHDARRTTLMRLGKATFIPLEHNDGAYIDVDARGYQFLLDYRSATPTLGQCSLGAIIDGNCEMQQLKGRIVLLDVHAESVNDTFLGPRALFPKGQNHLTGAAVHAITTEQIVRLARGESAPIASVREPLEVIFIWASCLSGVWLCRRAGVPLVAVIAASLAAFIASLSSCSFLLSYWLPPVAAVAGAIAASTSTAIARAVTEGGQ